MLSPTYLLRLAFKANIVRALSKLPCMFRDDWEEKTYRVLSKVKGGFSHFKIHGLATLTTLALSVRLENSYPTTK